MKYLEAKILDDNYLEEVFARDDWYLILDPFLREHFYSSLLKTTSVSWWM